MLIWKDFAAGYRMARCPLHTTTGRLSSTWRNNLKTHAGIETMLLTMRGTTDMPLRAVAFATDGVEHFLKGTMKTDTQDFLGKMEGFAVQGMKGINISSKHFMLLSIILEAASEKTISSYSYLFLSYPQNKRYK